MPSAKVTVSDSYDVQIDKVTSVVDAGTLIHPDQALAQMQSCINYGQSACMWGEITIKDGAVEQAIRSAVDAGAVGPATLIIAQLDPKTAWVLPEGFDLLDERRYGAARFLFLIRG